MKEKRVTITVNGHDIHLVLGRTWSDWDSVFGDDNSLWDFAFEELIDGTVEPITDIWYWYINGRCYETTEDA